MVVNHPVSDYKDTTINIKILLSAHIGHFIDTKKMNLLAWPHNIYFFQANSSFSYQPSSNFAIDLSPSLSLYTGTSIFLHRFQEGVLLILLLLHLTYLQ